MIWIKWIEGIRQLEPAFSRKKTFYWFILICAGFNLRLDFLGSASIVRALKLNDKSYQSICDFFHSSAIDLKLLTQLWSRFILKSLSQFVHVENGRQIFILDGIKAAKEGRKMPLVKLHHQESQNNSKSEYIWGHGAQAICALITVGIQSFAAPLIMRIQEGLGAKNRTILDKAIDLLKVVLDKNKFYLIGDAYYFSGKFFNEISKLGGDVISRARNNAVAFMAPEKKDIKSRGRPLKYGIKIKLKSLFNFKGFRKSFVTIYGKKSEVKIKEMYLVSKSFGQTLKYVFVISSKGQCIFTSTDLNLSAEKIIELYSLRFKIEFSFKELVHRIGVFCYRFWSKQLDKKRIKEIVKRKVSKEITYQIHLQLSCIVYGMLIYLSIVARNEIWGKFRGWLRTIKKENVPSTQIVQMALSETEKNFYHHLKIDKNMMKFVVEKKRNNFYYEDELAI